MRKFVFILFAFTLFSCSKKTQERKEPQSPEEFALAEKQAEKKRLVVKNRPPVGEVKIITDEIGCKWITLTVEGMSIYGDKTPAYSVDIEHHPKCANH
mgnify:CR=1 FL=1|jgi:hypothetical protein|tara:strand:- start:1878 stop:2171 length:294 start_codon:yes stop_codon:yes gene_type:complete